MAATCDSMTIGTMTVGSHFLFILYLWFLSKGGIFGSNRFENLRAWRLLK